MEMRFFLSFLACVSKWQLCALHQHDDQAAYKTAMKCMRNAASQGGNTLTAQLYTFFPFNLRIFFFFLLLAPGSQTFGSISSQPEFVLFPSQFSHIKCSSDVM